ncbi:hypothetical protein PENSPDRAFT_691745 [Peniophora sp. CONT]|nr:hypothetical protein PENSPDRAFT_691745 [Peniophora sp. CONT]
MSHISDGNKLDVLFILDTTGGMEGRIDEMYANLMNILYGIAASGLALSDIRVGLVDFRDHDYKPPSKDYGFAKGSDVSAIKARMQSLQVVQGGDGPEAQCEALNTASNTGWMPTALKIAIMITDSPPHGIGEDGDTLPNGCPSRMAFYLHCNHILNFSQRMIAGKMVPLMNSGELRPIIIGLVTESVDIHRLAIQYKAQIAAIQLSKADPEAISQILFDDWQAVGIQAHSFTFENIYEADDSAAHNAKVWVDAKQIDVVTKQKLNQASVDFRIKWNFRTGDGPKPTEISLTWKQVSRAQVDAIVAAALRKK